ncbi:hypothetical protein [Streptomyces sp. NPDC097610]|uniref:hypothetical protein n=1 Tax=Streptomyces sp. NPDC097610 TaxID=3157227 RepID=UPI00331F90B4
MRGSSRAKGSEAVPVPAMSAVDAFPDPGVSTCTRTRTPSPRSELLDLDAVSVERHRAWPPVGAVRR